MSPRTGTARSGGGYVNLNPGVYYATDAQVISVVIAKMINYTETTKPAKYRRRLPSVLCGLALYLLRTSGRE